jgi:hypothetical protein
LYIFGYSRQQRHDRDDCDRGSLLFCSRLHIDDEESEFDHRRNDGDGERDEVPKGTRRPHRDGVETGVTLRPSVRTDRIRRRLHLPLGSLDGVLNEYIGSESAHYRAENESLEGRSKEDADESCGIGEHTRNANRAVDGGCRRRSESTYEARASPLNERSLDAQHAD